MDAATEVFWRKGYDGASLDDLTEAMGINRPSLYSAFKDKKSLYTMVLKHYAESVGGRAMAAFVTQSGVRNAVTAFLSVSLDNQCRNAGLAKGCLFANCAAATLESHPEAEDILNEALTMSQRTIEDRFSDAIEKRELPDDFPVEERASMLLDFVQAQAYRARVGQTKETLAALIPSRVEAVLTTANASA